MKLYVSKKAIEKKGLDLFKNLKKYHINLGNFNTFNIVKYCDGNKFGGMGIRKGDDWFFYDDNKDEEVVFVKEL